MYASGGLPLYRDNTSDLFPITHPSRTPYTYDFHEKSPKKDRKWTLGSLFRRKKKDDSSSSGEDQNKGFLGKKKRKSEERKKKKPKPVFDHIVVQPGQRKSIAFNQNDDVVVKTKSEAIPSVQTKECSESPLRFNTEASTPDSFNKKNRRARAAARRTYDDGSSSEDSRSSCSPYRVSSESLQQSGSPLSRKSRHARTERYMKRHLTDPGDPGKFLQLPKSNGHWKSDASDRSSQRSGLSGTIPPSHSFQETRKPKVVNPFSSKSSYKEALSANEYNEMIKRYFDFVDNVSNDLNNGRSVSYDGDIHKRRDIIKFPVFKPNIEYKNCTFIDGMQINEARHPPPPPPRDPLRSVVANQNRSKSFNTNTFNSLHKQNVAQSPIQWTSRSVSENSLPYTQRILNNEAPAEKFNYLTEKKPRSRKPITIQNVDTKRQSALDFWKEKERLVQPSVAKVTAPQIFLPSVVQKQEVTIKDEDLQRKSTNLEEALDELEAIYNSLQLGDEDLLERAEQRERNLLPATMGQGHYSDSSFNYEPFYRKYKNLHKSNRRLDKKNDDMAFRKLNKERSKTICDPQSFRQSYLVSSPIYGDNLTTSTNSPDVARDDVVYRNVKHANQSLKVLDPQPPFGIPVGPIAPSANSDYLHANPEPYIRDSKTPDIVKDDLAFRNLRKDSTKEPLLIDDYKNNNFDPGNKINYEYLKKQRAVRSLSASIGSLINGKIKDEDVENEFNTLTDIADAMEIARQILKEKDQKINNTKKAFMSDTDTCYLRQKYKSLQPDLSKRRKTFLNNICSAEPVYSNVREVKESTPIPKSPLEELVKNTVEQSPEVVDEMQKINKEVQLLTDKVQDVEALDKSNIDKELSKPTSFDDEAHAKLCEKLLECVQDTNKPQTLSLNKDVDEEPDYENIISDTESNINFDQALKPDDSKTNSVYENVVQEDVSNQRGDVQPLNFYTDLVSLLLLNDYFRDEHPELLNMFGNRHERADTTHRQEKRRQLADGNDEKTSNLRKNTRRPLDEHGDVQLLSRPRTHLHHKLENISLPNMKTVNKSDGSEKIAKSKSDVVSCDLNDDVGKRRRRRVSKPDLSTTKIQKKPTDLTPTVSNKTSIRRLSVNMESARKATASVSEIGKTQRTTTKDSGKSSSSENDTNRFRPRPKISSSKRTSPDTNVSKTKSINQRIEALTAKTRNTLEKVETLTHKAQESRRKQRIKPAEVTIVKSETPPVSILKRNLGHEDSRTNDSHVSIQTPPVTFSPNLVEPSSSYRRQGILKKRRSLDESQVIRHRSCSPEILNKTAIRSSILKNQRRSSLEELTRSESPDTHLQGILKHKNLRSDDTDQSLNSPQGILKRKSGANSANAEQSSTHISITTAVILAAARGAEMVLDAGRDGVKPILKKKSFSEDNPYVESSMDAPKPILKKKSSTDTDDCDDKPKPILKSKSRETSECDSGIILEKNHVKSRSRRSYTICNDFDALRVTELRKIEDKGVSRSGLLSVHELVKTFEKSAKSSTGAIPKNRYINRNQERYKTQPVTLNDLQKSLNLLDKDSVSTAKPRWSGKYSLDQNFWMNSSGNLDKEHGKMSSDSAFQSLGDGLECGGQDTPRDEEDKKKLVILKNRQDISLGFKKSMSGRSYTVDEGISCNDSGSESDLFPSPVKLEKKSFMATVHKLEESLSDGESSGGKEVASIFRYQSKSQVRKQLNDVTMTKTSAKPPTNGEESHDEPKDDSTHVAKSQLDNVPNSIEEIRARLQEHHESNWKKRVPQNNNTADELKSFQVKNKYNEELSEKTILEYKKDELDAATNHWKSRVEKSDADHFSLAKRIGFSPSVLKFEKGSRIPKASPFKGKDLDKQQTARKKPDPSDASNKSVRVVSVIEPDDFTFKNFFKAVNDNQTDDNIDLTTEDFDAISRDSSLLILKKNVPVVRRKMGSKNPLRVLSERTDLSTEYTEILTGVAEREQKRLIIEKMSDSLKSNLAIESLAGLASKEDFKSVSLKKAQPHDHLKFAPFKDLMLIQVKGRRHVQVRLIKPHYRSINEGDCYLLVTPNKLYNYSGAYCNIIEQSKAADIAKHIQKTGDLGFQGTKVREVSRDVDNSKAHDFWKILGSSNVPKTRDAGQLEEDETYEVNIVHTNMIYTLGKNELVPEENYWGFIPKVEILTDTAVLVFDFGSEMYVWSGKNADVEKKRMTLDLAQQIWDNGYNYSECDICPLDNLSSAMKFKSEFRPDWALFAKLTQHRETSLFKEKFLDWVDNTPIIKFPDEDLKTCHNPYFVQPCNIFDMIRQENHDKPDLKIQDFHLGRGASYYDEETRRLFEFNTIKINVWMVSENNSKEINDSSIGQFYDGDSYILYWKFRMTVKGRELNGNPSKHLPVGKDKTVFFFWHGINSSVNERGAAALLTVELDKESAPQIKINQGHEPAAFLRLFGGSMIIHSGKRCNVKESLSRLFIARGELEDEFHLMEVPLEMGQLRSRTTFLLLDLKNSQVMIWHGAQSPDYIRESTMKNVKSILMNKPQEFNLQEINEELDIVELDEGDENEDFFDILGHNRKSYLSMIGDVPDYNFTPRLFHFNSLSGHFQASEVMCPYRSDKATPYPFLQTELYDVGQPALFLFDNHHELWLWQGWWPPNDEDAELSDKAASSLTRYQSERRAAMQTVINYWKEKHEGNEVCAYIVFAGLEPLEFRNLFPSWIVQEEVANLNLKEGRQYNDKLSLEQELSYLTRTTYSITELFQRPLPEGVDPRHLEMYLSDDDFVNLIQMSKEEFQKLPSWKQNNIKKDKGLF